MKYISKPQLVAAIKQLAGFKSAVNKQGAQHILPLLALRRKEVSTDKLTSYAEKDDYDFFNEFARVNESEYPYFDPIAGIFRISTHPHSNIATARKGTFFRSWDAGTLDSSSGEEKWKLANTYLDIVSQKALMKSGKKTKVPAFALGAFLFRKRALPDAATPKDLANLIKTEFHLSEKEYQELFVEEGTLGDFALTGPLSDPEVAAAIDESGVVAEVRENLLDFQELSLKKDDPILVKVKLLLEDGYAGVIFVGPPGTSKSWYAVQVALALADGNGAQVRKIQFHKSFQYEHFVEGFVPTAAGTGFELREQLMLRVIKDAEANQAGTYVVLIDELSRSDPGRVFGELLTYMEPSRRNETFSLASGREISIPANIVFLATMNSRDKGVQEIDDAFDRRMAKMEFAPDVAILEEILKGNGMPEDLRRKIQGFLKWVGAKHPLGHAFFRSVKDLGGLERLWETQLRFVFEKQYKYEPATFEEIRGKFSEITGAKVQ